MSRIVGQANSDQSHVKSQRATDVLNTCPQGFGHTFNFHQSQVKHVRWSVWVLQARVFAKVDRVFFNIIHACFQQGPLFFCKLK